MGYNTEGTDWPHGDVVSEASKDLIDRFFSLLDREDDDAAAATVGDVLADEIFAPSGQAHFHGQVFAGPEGLYSSSVLLLLQLCWSCSTSTNTKFGWESLSFDSTNNTYPCVCVWVYRNPQVARPRVEGGESAPTPPDQGLLGRRGRARSPVHRTRRDGLPQRQGRRGRVYREVGH